MSLSNEEVWALNVLAGTIAAAEQELRRSLAAREAFIKLLELKYGAAFDRATGQLNPKEGVKQP